MRENRRRLQAIFLSVICALTLLQTAASAQEWKTGTARAIITPETPVWLAGYGSKRAPDGKLHELWMKTLVLEDNAGHRVVLVTSDFQGVPKSFSDPVFVELQKKYGLERHQVMITFSHNHCGPRLGDDLVDYYPVDEDQVRLVDEYSAKMQVRLVEMVGAALATLEPVSISAGSGQCTFAVNRRNNREADVSALIAAGTPLIGPVDHSVPVLTVTRPDGSLKTVLFGYACHPTTLSFMTWCGDYPGFAQLEIETSHPGTMAMFVNTCGGDQNPLPRRTVELCQKYGHQLAVAVEEALKAELKPIGPGIRTEFEMIELPYLSVVTDEELDIATSDSNAVKARWASRMKQLRANGTKFPESYPYPVHAWRLGSDTHFIGMGAETVVDYALKFKGQYGGNTWVCGYADDMIAYIPSRRVWEEGGYEGGSNLYEYGRPAYRWSGEIETIITSCVDRLVSRIRNSEKLADIQWDRGSWEQVTADAGWKPRDSSGEVAFRDRIWIFGGWYDSYSAPPRDVWSSADGKTWELVTAEAPWKYSDLAMTTVFKDRMWILGGWYNGRLEGHGATDEVWSSDNGKDWVLETDSPGWTPRISGGLVEFKDQMWLLGGTENYYFGDRSSLRSDVWSTSDGKTWTQHTSEAPCTHRAYHQSVAHDGKLWVFGGGNYVPEYEARNDVWSSTDGKNWECVTENAPWSPRLWFSAVTLNNRMWVLGGWSNNPARNWGDVWSSTDGKTWTEMKCEPMWKERHEHSAFVFQNTIWIAAGHAQPLSSEVWKLQPSK